MSQTRKRLWTRLSVIALGLLMVVTPGFAFAPPEPIPVDSLALSYENIEYGFSLRYPEGWALEPVWETGQWIVTALKGPDVRVFIIVNPRPAGMSLREWITQRDKDLAGEITAEIETAVGSAQAVQREYLSHGHAALSVYTAVGNKFYEFNAGPLTDETRPVLSAILHQFAVFSTRKEVPTRSLEASARQVSPDALTPNVTPPVLQFPFTCDDTWTITRGYMTDPNSGHGSSNQYSWYALDWIRAAGATDGQPARAAHGGQVHNYWDSTGGGNAVKVAADGDQSHYLTFYIHLKSFSQAEGTWVTQGTEIAKIDCTGTACSGTHLHFAYWYDNKSIKPEPMSGYTGFLAGQSYSYSCACCGCGSSSGASVATSRALAGLPPFQWPQAAPQPVVSSVPAVSPARPDNPQPRPADLRAQAEALPPAVSWPAPIDLRAEGEPLRVPPASDSFTISKSVFASGGGAKSSANYHMQGTTGQATGTGTLSAAGYRLRSGYWSAPTCTSAGFAAVPTIARAGASGLTLTWEAVPGATGYHIYRGVQPYFEPVAPYESTAAAEWTDPNAVGDPLVNHTYIVDVANACNPAATPSRMGEFDFALEAPPGR